MTFNYGNEKRKFEKEWAKTEAFYREQGMSESAIQQMLEYDWGLFKATRTEALHTQDVDFQPEDDEEALESPMLIKFFDGFTNRYDTHGTHDRYWWLEELSDPRLVSALHLLTEEDKELLTLLFVDGYTQKECAVKLHITQGTISYRIKCIFGKINKN